MTDKELTDLIGGIIYDNADSIRIETNWTGVKFIASLVITALREANVLPVWRTIDSAPRDGTWFQVACIGEYCGNARSEPGGYDEHLEPVTHWQPLPTPPENVT